MHLYNLKAGDLFCANNYFKVCTSARYLGCYIGDEKSKRDWLKNWTEKWERKVPGVHKTEVKYPQESYITVDNEVHLK